MVTLISIALILISLAFLSSIFIWNKINYSWLTNGVRFLVFSLPFERIPSFDTPVGTLRISQILIIICIYFVFLLFLKKDEQILQKKLDFSHLLVFLFFIFSIPSWFFVSDFKRFIVYMIATTFVFLAYTLISLFLENPLKVIKELILVLFFVGLFGLYQLVADFINIPYQLTGLQETYTKINFGIARVHATAVEPLYYGGMLFLPLFTLLLFILNDQPILEIEKVKNNFIKKISPKTSLLNFSNNFNFLVFIVILLNFVLTLSKGSWLSIGLTLPFFAILLFRYFRFTDFLRKFSTFLYIFSFLIAFSFFYIEKFNAVFFKFYKHIWSTIRFNAATSVERLDFILTAFQILPRYIITGIGPGQYGVWYGLIGSINPIEDILNPMTKDVIATRFRTDQIVNNVYLEVWLEFGLFSFLIFISFLIFLIFLAYKNFSKQLSAKQGVFKNPSYSAYLGLLMAVLSYLIQWMFFSPIFIMPIFILLGLLHRFNRKYSA
jgi:O-antigen ligase